MAYNSREKNKLVMETTYQQEKLFNEDIGSLLDNQDITDSILTAFFKVILYDQNSYCIYIDNDL